MSENSKYKVWIEGNRNSQELAELLKVFLAPEEYALVRESEIFKEQTTTGRTDRNSSGQKELKDTAARTDVDLSEQRVLKNIAGRTEEDWSEQSLLNETAARTDVDLSEQRVLKNIAGRTEEDSLEQSLLNITASWTEEDSSELNFMKEIAGLPTPVLPFSKAEADLIVPDEEDGNARKRILFEALRKKTGDVPPWGILTGVRPVKLAGKLKKEKGRDGAWEALTRQYKLDFTKADLLLDIWDYQMDKAGKPDSKSVGVYVGIPFCPTRCLYCSFASNKAESGKIARYLKALHREIDFMAGLMKDCGLWAETLYLGGGTPTTLEEEQLAELLAHMAEAFGKTKELTLEGGRPETLTIGKLETAKKYGVTRISINPQTMHLTTLDRIGRGHSVLDIKDAFAMAKEVGLRNINADLIAGLPGEDVEDFEDSLLELIKLEPTNITVHSLAVKRASRLMEQDRAYHYRNGQQVRSMVDRSGGILRPAGYRPYYLYRQKNMAGAGENVGWCKDGTESLYNIRIMDERQSIMAAGAGAMSKCLHQDGTLTRSPNLTNVDLYIERLQEMFERKRKLFMEDTSC